MRIQVYSNRSVKNMPNDEQTELLREILKWTRFTAMKEVKDTLSAALDTPQKKQIYQLSDGEKSGIEISKAVGTSHTTVHNYWKAWAKVGIVEPLRARGGDRYKRSFDLEDFGIGP